MLLLYASAKYIISINLIAPCENSTFRPSLCHSADRYMLWGLSHYLLTYTVCANSECIAESAQMHMLTITFSGRIQDK